MRMKVSINDIIIGKMQGEDVIIVNYPLTKDEWASWVKAPSNEGNVP